MLGISSDAKHSFSKAFSYRPQAIFGSAMALLVVCLIFTYLSFSYLRDADYWVNHTHEVRGALGDLEADLNHAARARLSYLIAGGASDLEDYRTVVRQIPTRLGEVSRLTSDSPVQAERCRQLEKLIDDRIQAWELSISQKQKDTPVDLRALLNQNLDLSARNAAVTEAIRTEESRLLAPRIRTANRSFVVTSLVVGATFTIALAFLSVYYGLLSRQLQARENAERQAREAYDSEVAARREAEDFRLFI